VQFKLHHIFESLKNKKIIMEALVYTFLLIGKKAQKKKLIEVMIVMIGFSGVRVELV
jgi:hypothetical protein